MKARRPTRYGVAWAKGRCFASQGKVRYRTEREALQALARIMQTAMVGRAREKVPTGAYACADCAGWHLTSQPTVNRVVVADLWSHCTASFR